MDELNTMQPGRSSVLVVGSEQCQLLYELLGDNVIRQYGGVQ